MTDNKKERVIEGVDKDGNAVVIDTGIPAERSRGI